MLATNAPYTSNYDTKCVSFVATSIWPCKLRHFLVVRFKPNRVAVGSPSRRSRAAVWSPLRRCLSYYAGLQFGVSFGSRRHCGDASRTIRVCSSGFLSGGAATAPPLRQCFSYFAGLQVGLMLPPRRHCGNASHTMRVCCLRFF